MGICGKEEILFLCVVVSKGHPQCQKEPEPILYKELEAEPNVGKAIGIAMKYFKEKKIPVNGKDVAEVVREMKNG